MLLKNSHSISTAAWVWNQQPHAGTPLPDILLQNRPRGKFFAKDL